MLQTFKDKMKSFSMAKKLALLLAVVIIAVMGIGSTFAYVITGTPSLVNLFINGLSPDGNLTIEKTLKHPYGKDYIVPQGLAFTFDVELGSEYAGETIKTTQGEMTADENGILTLAIGPSGRATIYDIDEDTVVTVTEINIGKGFTPAKKSKEITIEKYKDNFLTFANTYEPEKASTEELAVSGVKVLEGRDWLDGDSFTFALEVYDASKDKWNALGEEKVTYQAPAEGETEDPDFNKFDFTEIIGGYDFDKMGTYIFRVTEVEGTIGGITYDKTESYFDIVVGDDNMDGFLEIQSVSSTSANTEVEKQAVDIIFKNSYAPEGSAKADIKIQKIMNDLSGQNMSPAGYEFELYDDKDKLIATSQQTNALGETSLMIVFTPEEANASYTYVLKEKGAGDAVAGMYFDDKEYKLQADVIDNLDGTVSAVIYEAPKQGQTPEDAAKDADAVFEAEFTNVYDPTDTDVIISGKKTLDGRKLFDKEFKFELYEADKEFDVSKDAEPIDTALNKENGNFAFKELPYTEVGTYHYVVKENAGDQIRGIKYDKTRFFVTVEVTDEAGALKVAKSIVNDDGIAVEDIEFVNEYIADPVRYVLHGGKVLEGAELDDEMFSFQLFAADEEFTPAGEPFSTVWNNAEGEFCFDELVFSAPGTYRYLVVEDTSVGATAEDIAGTAEGEDPGTLTYDQRDFQVTVEVSDRGVGQLQVEDVTYAVNGEEVDDLKFINIYKAPEPVEPEDPEQPDEPDKPETPVDPDEDEPGYEGDGEEEQNPESGPTPGDTEDEEQGDKPEDGDKEPGDKPEETTPDGEEPDTGDHSNLGLYASLMAAAIAMITILTMRRRKTMR